MKALVNHNTNDRVNILKINFHYTILKFKKQLQIIQ